jgi:hypothetical protein
VVSVLHPFSLSLFLVDADDVTKADPSVLPIIVDSLGKSLEPLRAVIPISSLPPETADRLPPARLGVSDAEAVKAVMPALQQLQNAATFSGQLDEVLQTLYTQGERIPQGATLTRVSERMHMRLVQWNLTRLSPDLVAPGCIYQQRADQGVSF